MRQLDNVVVDDAASLRGVERRCDGTALSRQRVCQIPHLRFAHAVVLRHVVDERHDGAVVQLQHQTFVEAVQINLRHALVHVVEVGVGPKNPVIWAGNGSCVV